MTQLMSRIPDRLLILGAAGITLLSLLGIHWIVTVAALGAVALLSIKRPELAIAGVVASIPVQSEIMVPFVAGELTLTQVMLFGLIAGWGVVFWTRRIWVDSIVVGFLLVLAAYAVSFIAVDDPGLWFQESYRWAVAGIFYVICRSVIDSWRAVRYCLWAMLIGVVGVSLQSLLQLVTDQGPAHFLSGSVIRVYGSFGTPNTLAAYMEMTVPFFLACIPLAWQRSAEQRFGDIEKWALLGASGLGALVIGLTQSRGGWIGFALGCAVLWWQFNNRVKIVSFLVAIVTVGGFLMTSPGQSQFDRFLELQGEPTEQQSGEFVSSFEEGSGRSALWGTAVVMIQENPFTGVGAGEFDENYRENVVSWFDRFPRGQAHNVWLQMGAQAGVWGIAAYAAWFAASIWSVITARRRATSRFNFWIISGVLAVFVAYAAHSMVDYLNVLSLGLQLSALTAIALNLAPEPLTRYESTSDSVPSNVVPEPA